MTVEKALYDDWFVVAERELLGRLGRIDTVLFEEPVSVTAHNGEAVAASHAATGAALPVREAYGHVWTCLGAPARDIADFPECREPDRLLVTGGSIGVEVSGLRAVENFLDLGHFPFVHTDYLGVEPHTEVETYDVQVTEDDEILATNCRFYQPMASPSGDAGFVVDYVYKVVRPYVVVLYKTNPVETARQDFIALMLQPVGQERCIGHSFLAYLKHNIDAETVRWYMQLIFAQDKPILENQTPKRLPLDTASEVGVRADASSYAYRQWLSRHGIAYGAIPVGL